MLNVIISRVYISMERLESYVFITSISIEQKELRLLVLDFKVNYIQTNSEVNLTQPFVWFSFSQRVHALVPPGFHAGQLRSCNFYPKSKYTLVSTSGQVGAGLLRSKILNIPPPRERRKLVLDIIFFRGENLFLGV